MAFKIALENLEKERVDVKIRMLNRDDMKHVQQIYLHETANSNTNDTSSNANGKSPAHPERIKELLERFGREFSFELPWVVRRYLV